MSDIHLGRTFSDLSKFSLKNDKIEIFKSAVKNSFFNAINIAVEKEVDFVLISGDTFDSSEQDFNSKLILKEGLNRLKDNNIKVFLICGNHDPLTSFNKNTFNFDKNSGINIVGLNSDISEKFEIINRNGEKEGIIHALSYQDKIFNGNPIKYFDYINQNDKNLFHIGMLHCELNSDKLNPYAPVSESELKALNYDYWALGHIHVPMIKENNIVYSGTIQGRNIKESGAHGIRYIKTENKTIIENNFIPCDEIRYDDIYVNLNDIEDDTSALDLILNQIYEYKRENNVKLSLLNIILNGRITFTEDINDDFFEAAVQNINDKFNDEVIISKFTNNLSPLADEELLLNDDGISKEIYKLSNNDEIMNGIYNNLENELSKLMPDCHYSEDELKEFKQKVLTQAKEGCLNLCSILYSSKGADK